MGYKNFKYATSGDAVFIDKAVSLLNGKGYKEGKGKTPKPGEYIKSHNGYELTIKEDKYNTPLHIRIDENGKIQTICSYGSCWVVYELRHNRYGYCYECASWQLGHHGDVEQTEPEMSRLLKLIDDRTKKIYPQEIYDELERKWKENRDKVIDPVFEVGDLVRERYPEYKGDGMLWLVESVDKERQRYQLNGYALKYRNRYGRGLSFSEQGRYKLAKKSKTVKQ